MNNYNDNYNNNNVGTGANQGWNNPGNVQGQNGAPNRGGHRGRGRQFRGGYAGRGGRGGAFRQQLPPYGPWQHGTGLLPPGRLDRALWEMDNALVPMVYQPRMTTDTMVHARNSKERDALLENPHSGLDTHFRVPGGDRQVNVWTPSNVAGRDGIMLIAEPRHAQHMLAMVTEQSGTELVQMYLAGHDRERWNTRKADALMYWSDTSIAEVEQKNLLNQTPLTGPQASQNE